jgi:hypothetical protein
VAVQQRVARLDAAADGGVGRVGRAEVVDLHAFFCFLFRGFGARWIRYCVWVVVVFGGDALLLPPLFARIASHIVIIIITPSLLTERRVDRALHAAAQLRVARRVGLLHPEEQVAVGLGVKLEAVHALRRAAGRLFVRLFVCLLLSVVVLRVCWGVMSKGARFVSAVRPSRRRRRRRRPKKKRRARLVILGLAGKDDRVILRRRRVHAVLEALKPLEVQQPILRLWLCVVKARVSKKPSLLPRRETTTQQ